MELCPRPSDEETLDAFIESLGLKFFEPEEITCFTDIRGNNTPPQILWHNIGPTLVILDKLRAHFGQPLIISSSYRSEKYNRMESGVPLSQHIAFTAIDFVISRTPPEVVASQLRKWRGKFFDAPEVFVRKEVKVPLYGTIPFCPLIWRKRDGKPQFQFRGGVKPYRSFVHLDTRGLDSSW